MRKILCLFLLMLLSSLINAQTVVIGTQVWMTENLNVSFFRNGEPIPEAKTKKQWVKAAMNKQPAWCYFDNDTINGTKYGKLYNWYAVNDPRGLAPDGYHVPKDEEWTALEDYLGGKEVAGIKMKSTSGWEENGGEDFNGTNESGFNGFPGGGRLYNGSFYFAGSVGYWWSSTDYLSNSAWYHNLNYYEDAVTRYFYSCRAGFSVRCIQD